MKNINANAISRLTKSGKVIIVFYGTGCINCKIMQPTIEKLEPLFPDVMFYHVNVDLYPHLIQSYKINSLPTLLPFYHGQSLSAIIGVKSFQVLKKLIHQTLYIA